MIQDEPKGDAAPLALPDLAMVEPDIVQAAAVVESKPEKNDGNDGLVEGKSEEEDDSDVIVEAMPVEGNSGAVAAAPSLLPIPFRRHLHPRRRLPKARQ